MTTTNGHRDEAKSPLPLSEPGTILWGQSDWHLRFEFVDTPLPIPPPLAKLFEIDGFTAVSRQSLE